MSKTTALVPAIYATGGAVTQDGKLKIYSCNTCGQQVVWATSSRTGRMYLVNISHGALGQRFYMKHLTHNCAAHQAYTQSLTAALNDTPLTADQLVADAQFEVMQAAGWCGTWRQFVAHNATAAAV